MTTRLSIVGHVEAHLLSGNAPSFSEISTIGRWAIVKPSLESTPLSWRMQKGKAQRPWLSCGVQVKGKAKGNWGSDGAGFYWVGRERDYRVGTIAIIGVGNVRGHWVGNVRGHGIGAYWGYWIGSIGQLGRFGLVFGVGCV